MDAQRLIQTLIELCRIPSPSGREGGVAAIVRSRMAALGLEVEEDGAGQALGSDTGNLVVRVPGRGEPLFIAAHMDTVPVPAGLARIPIFQSEDRIDTGGASVLGYDNKGGVAAMLELAEMAAARKGEMLPLELIFTIQEERGLLGSRAFDASRLQARSGFVLDNERPVGSCLCAQPAKATFTIEVHGKAAHAAVAPEAGINAIKALGAIIQQLPSGRLDDETVMNLGKVEGGGALNIVPDRAVLTGELRSLSDQKQSDWAAQIRWTAETAAAPWNARVDFQYEPLYARYQVSPETRCGRLFSAACQLEGLEARFERSMGGSDANNFNQKGLACLNMGIEMNQIHSTAEFMRPSQLIRAVSILERMIRA